MGGIAPGVMFLVCLRCVCGFDCSVRGMVGLVEVVAGDVLATL